MKRTVSILAFVITFLSTTGAFAQGRPEWIGQVKQTLKQKETAWKIEDGLLNDSEVMYEESFRFKKGAFTGVVEIDVYYILTNPEETFGGIVTVTDNLSKREKKTKLPGLGDEGYMWTSSNAGDYTKILFKKDKTFVSIWLPGRALAQRVAKHVAAHMP